MAVFAVLVMVTATVLLAWRLTLWNVYINFCCAGMGVVAGVVNAVLLCVVDVEDDPPWGVGGVTTIFMINVPVVIDGATVTDVAISYDPGLVLTILDRSPPWPLLPIEAGAEVVGLVGSGSLLYAITVGVVID